VGDIYYLKPFMCRLAPPWIASYNRGAFTALTHALVHEGLEFLTAHFDVDRAVSVTERIEGELQRVQPLDKVT